MTDFKVSADGDFFTVLKPAQLRDFFRSIGGVSAWTGDLTSEELLSLGADIEHVSAIFLCALPRAQVIAFCEAVLERAETREAAIEAADTGDNTGSRVSDAQQARQLSHNIAICTSAAYSQRIKDAAGIATLALKLAELAGERAAEVDALTADLLTMTMGE